MTGDVKEKNDGARLQVLLFGADDCELDTLMDAAEKVMERFPYASIDMRARIGTAKDENAASGN